MDGILPRDNPPPHPAPSHSPESSRLNFVGASRAYWRSNFPGSAIIHTIITLLEWRQTKEKITADAASRGIESDLLPAGQGVSRAE